MTISKIIGITDPALNIGVHTYFSSSIAGEIEVWSAVNDIEDNPEAAILIKVNPDWPILVLKIVGIPSMIRFLHIESDCMHKSVYEKFDEYQSIECLNYDDFYLTINTLVPVTQNLFETENGPYFSGNYQRVCCSMVLTEKQRKQIFTTIGNRFSIITEKYKPKKKGSAKIISVQ